MPISERRWLTAMENELWMMNMPMKSANALGDVHHQRVAGQHGFELLPAAGRRLNLEGGPEQGAQFPLGLDDRDAGRKPEVDAVERAAAPEHLLRCVDVHHGEIPVEGARQSG